MKEGLCDYLKMCKLEPQTNEYFIRWSIKDASLLISSCCAYKNPFSFVNLLLKHDVFDFMWDLIYWDSHIYIDIGIDIYTRNLCIKSHDESLLDGFL